MMNMKYTCLPVVATLLLGACSTDDIDLFDSNNYLSFDVAASTTGTPSLAYTFTFQDASVTEYTYEVPVTYAGRFLDAPATFRCQVLTEESTAQEGVHYVWPGDESGTVEADSQTGTLRIKLLRTADMKTNTYDLTLQLLPNGSFLTGAVDKLTLHLTDQLVKPDYWDYTYDRYLGGYTPIKFRLFLEFMGVTDGSNPFDRDPYVYWTDRGTGQFIYKNFNEGEIKVTVSDFRQWLHTQKGNPTEADGVTPVAETLGNY